MMMKEKKKMFDIVEYLKDNGFTNKGEYWKRDDVYIQYDSVVMRITIGQHHQDYPISLIKVFPEYMETRIDSLRGTK